MRLAAALLLLSLLAAAPDAFAQSSTRSVSWQRYDVDLTLQTDGSLQVAESQTVSFQGTYQQGSRTIPLNRTTGITDLSVSELDNGQSTPLQPTTQTQNDQLSVTWSFPAVTNGTRTFVLRYVAHGAARLYSNGDQLDWNAIYSGTPGPIVAGTVTLHLPGDVKPNDIQAAGYLLPQNRIAEQTGGGTLDDSRTISYAVPSLPAGTGFEVRAQFPHGLLTAASVPPWQADADRADEIQQNLAPIAAFLSLLLTIAFVAGGGAGLFLLWYTRGRELDPGPVPAVLDTPPSELPAPLVGTLVDSRADLRDAVATLVDLAQRGIVTMEDAQGDVRVTLHGRAEDPALRRYERVLLVALFDRGASGGEVLLSSARVRFAAAVPVLEERLYEAVVDEGLFEANPDLTRRNYLRVGGLIGAIGAVLAGVLAFTLTWLSPIVWMPGAALLLIGAALCWLSRAMPRRTPRGALEAARWRAFRHHLATEPRSNEYLAYAVALGIDRDYLQQLQLQGSPPPQTVLAPQGGPGGLIFFPGWYGYGYGDRGSAPGAPVPQGGTVGTAQSPGAGGGGPQSWSDALADLLNAASGALSHGGGSGPWSGGGWGGGGGGGGGSGGWN